MLIIMYGYRILGEQQDITAVTLAESMRQSGLQIDRLDRIVMVYREFIRRGGAKRGTRYSLNNLGVTRAETILRDMYV